MTARKILAAGLVAMFALTAAPASAGGLSFEFGSGGVEFDFPRHGHWGSWDRDHDRGSWRRHDDRHDFLSPQEVRRILRDRGYRQIDYVDRRGAIYQAEATRHDRRYGLVVSARDGEILNRYRIRRHG
jgi:hypothetical protein